MLIQGAGGRPPDPRATIEQLNLASRRSAEAAFKLGKLFLDGKKVR
jgi:hypothetical protein